MSDSRVPATPGTAGVLTEALKAQAKYEEARATRLGRGAERLTAPLGSVAARLVPPGLVRRGLAAADRLAGMTLRDVVSPHDIDDLAACDAAALKVQGWSVGSNAATGGAAGWFGAAGMSADIPATIALAARNVRATGAAYGFAGEGEEEAAFRLMVLEVATSIGEEGRQTTLHNLNAMARYLATPEGRMALEKGGEWVSEKIVERLARQFGASLAGRRAGRLVPVVGGAVAAMVNASFQTDVSRAARYAYRQRWLMARKALPAPPPDTAKEES
ncbi:EcsC family protein [Roseicyclus sp. F158]|uniref:EcsC family protein n=1 Tax=Tropicimonas omnivorans TaxID=3075590 RepID=A0ABU3DIU9_9RHOB|nr:EcsC family protein [Roseicyclus sp. F158]MDT0683650.1 EcsC family protein [Roseicyclus sp. F158]